MKQLSLVIPLVFVSAPAMAYVGPGLGMGVIGTIFGVLAAIVLAMFGLFWYPLKRAFNKRKASTDGSQIVPTITENEQADHLGTTPTRLENPSETRSGDHVTNHQPSGLHEKPDTATSNRTDSQVR